MAKNSPSPVPLANSPVVLNSARPSGSQPKREPHMSSCSKRKHPPAKRLPSKWHRLVVLFLVIGLNVSMVSTRTVKTGGEENNVSQNKLPEWKPRDFKCVQHRGITHHVSFRRSKLTNSSTLRSIKNEIMHTKGRTENFLNNNKELKEHKPLMHDNVLPFLNVSPDFDTKRNVTLPDALQVAAKQVLRYMYAVELYRWNLLNHGLNGSNPRAEKQLIKFNNFALSDLQDDMENTHKHIMDKIHGHQVPVSCAELEAIYRAEPTPMDEHHLDIFLYSFVHKLENMLTDLNTMFDNAIAHENQNAAEKMKIMKKEDAELASATSSVNNLNNLGHREEYLSGAKQISSIRLGRKLAPRRLRRPRHPRHRHPKRRFVD